MALDLKPIGEESSGLDLQPKVNIRDTLAEQVSIENIDRESVERNKMVIALQQKGHSITNETADLYRSTLFGKDTSWSAASKQMVNDLSVEPLGQVKKSAKANAWRLVPAATVKYTYGGMAGIAGLAQKLIADYGDENSFGYGLMGEWRNQLIKEGEDKSRVWDSKVPDEVKSSLPGQILSGIGQLFTLPMYAVAGVGASMTVGQVYEEAYSEAIAKGKGEKEARDIAGIYTVSSAPMEVASDMFKIGLGKTLVKSAGAIPRSAFKKAADVAIKGQIAGAIEGGTEAAQSATLQGLIDGKVDLKQTAVEGFVGYVIGVIGGTGIAAASSYQKLVDSGVAPETAKIITEAVTITDGVKYDSNGVALQDQGGGNFIFNAGNTPILKEAIADAAMQIKDTVETMQLSEPNPIEITGYDGGPLTQDDLVTHRNQPDFIDSLIPSPEADVLKKAVIENDGSSMAEYNQGLVGVAEEAPAIETESKQAEQTPTQEALQQEAQIQLEEDNQIRMAADEEIKPEPITVEEVIADLESDKPIQTVSEKAQRVLNAGSKINSILAKGASVSTRITEIAPEVGIQFRNMYRNLHKYMSDGVNQTAEFVGSYNKAVTNLDEQQVLELNAALRMGDFAKVESFGVTGIESLRTYLLDRGTRTNRAMIENYFPSGVEDYKGLSKFLGSQPKGVFEAQLKAKAKKLGRELTQDERLSTIRSLLSSGDSTFGSDKARTLENVTPEMIKFYKNPIEKLAEYNAKTARALAIAEFTGKVPVFKEGDFDATESIDAIILSSLESGDLSYDNQAKLKEYLKAGLNYRANNPVINTYRRMVSLKFVTKIKTSIAQFGDIGANIGENGLRAVLADKADFAINVMKREMKLALEDIDVNALDMEIQETKQSQVEDLLYQPLQRPDALNKVWLARSSFEKWNKLAKENPAALEKLLTKKWGVPKFSKTVVKDLADGKWTDATKLAGYMQVADFHPTSPAEQIKVAMENPAIRVFTVLKSFAFKRYDRIYRESLRDIVSGNSKIVAGGVDNNTDMIKEGSRQVIDGSIGMAKFLIWSVGFESNLEWIWNELKKAMGFAEDKEDDSLVDFYLKNIGRLIPFIDAYDIEQAFQRKDPVRVFTSIAELPEPIGSDIVQTLYKASLKDQEIDNQIDWLKDIPYIGEFAYGKAKKEETETKKYKKASSDPYLN